MREFFRKKLNGYLELSPDEAFMQLIWAANMMQAGQPGAARNLRNVPTGAVTDEITSPLFLYKWELETLANALLVVPKRAKPIRGQWRELDCSRYDAFQNIVRTLRRLENAEAGIRLKRINVLDEMPRISARQHDWQRGWFNTPQLYRSAFIYGQGASADYFERTHGLSINDFSFIGFALHTNFAKYSSVMRDFDWRPMSIDASKFERALSLLSVSIDGARTKARLTICPHGWVEYQPSILRQYPCIAFGDRQERIRSPLPQLILERVSSGVFYDIIGAGGEIRDEYGRRFEQYALQYLQTMLPSLDWQPEQEYRVRKAPFKSPDIISVGPEGLRLAVECKATRMSIDARYADDPLTVRGYEDLIKGVFQLWRYFSHCRRGITKVTLAGNVTGLVLTLDDWLVMANRLIKDVLNAAEKMAAEKDPEILPEDRKPILFCAITDLENTLATANGASFDAAITRAVAENRGGWLLSSSHDEVRPADVQRKPYPFSNDLSRVLPWWNWIEEERKARSAGLESGPY